MTDHACKCGHSAATHTMHRGNGGPDFLGRCPICTFCEGYEPVRAMTTTDDPILTALEKAVHHHIMVQTPEQILQSLRSQGWDIIPLNPLGLAGIIDASPRVKNLQAQLATKDAEIARLEIERDGYWEALDRYGIHDGHCPSWQRPEAEEPVACTCGFFAAKTAELKETK